MGSPQTEREQRFQGVVNKILTATEEEKISIWNGELMVNNTQYSNSQNRELDIDGILNLDE